MSQVTSLIILDKLYITITEVTCECTELYINKGKHKTLHENIVLQHTLTIHCHRNCKISIMVSKYKFSFHMSSPLYLYVFFASKLSLNIFSQRVYRQYEYNELIRRNITSSHVNRALQIYR